MYGRVDQCTEVYGRCTAGLVVYGGVRQVYGRFSIYKVP